MDSAIVLVLIGLGGAMSATATQATEPLLLTAAQMDDVTAGAADLRARTITSNASPRAVVGRPVFFDSGVQNTGDTGTGVFNIKWFVDGREVGAYGSHAGVPARQTVMNGNSQFSWTFDSPGWHSVTFTVDVDNHIQETTDRNNSMMYNVRVAATPRVKPQPVFPNGDPSRLVSPPNGDPSRRVFPNGDPSRFRM